MGKGVIVSAIGEGAYLVKVEHNRARINAEIAALEARIIEQEQSVLDAQTKKAQALGEHDAAVEAVNNAIEILSTAAESGDGDAIQAAQDSVTSLTAAAIKTDGALQRAKTDEAMEKSALIGFRLRLTQLQAIPEDPEKIAYCADYSTALSGTVGTIELPASEGSEVVTIRPDHPGSASAYNATTDGQLMHRIGMSPAQAFYNAAILPGWQRHAPLYRSGELTAVDKGAHTGSVSLGATTSSAQSLSVNESETLTGVPIQYMTCDSQPFEVGDRVIVRFQGDWTTPVIIGFEVTPKACEGDYGNENAGIAPSFSFHTDTALLKGSGLIQGLPGLCAGDGCSSPFMITSFRNLGPVCSFNSNITSTDWVPDGGPFILDGTSITVRWFTRNVEQTYTITDLGYTATMDHYREIPLGGRSYLFKFEQTFGRSGTYISNSQERTLWSVPAEFPESRGSKYSWTRTEQRTDTITDTIQTRMFVAPPGFGFVDAGIVHTMSSPYTLSFSKSFTKTWPAPEQAEMLWEYQRTFNIWERVYEVSADNVEDPTTRGGYEYTAVGSYAYTYDDTYQPTTTHGFPDPFFPEGTQIAYTYERTSFGSPVTYASNTSGSVSETMASNDSPGRVVKPIVPTINGTMTGDPTGFFWF